MDLPHLAKHETWILVEFSLPVFYAVAVGHLHRMQRRKRWDGEFQRNRIIIELGAGRTFVQKQMGSFHFTDGKNRGPERRVTDSSSQSWGWEPSLLTWTCFLPWPPGSQTKGFI